jgi:hypothetical protein
LGKGREGGVEVACGAGVEEMQLQPESTCGRLQVSRLGLSIGTPLLTMPQGHSQ